MATMISDNDLTILGMILFFAGLGFKISLVPFHFWTADVYEGAPISHCLIPVRYFERCSGLYPDDLTIYGSKTPDAYMGKHVVRSGQS